MVTHYSTLHPDYTVPVSCHYCEAGAVLHLDILTDRPGHAIWWDCPECQKINETIVP